MLIHFGDCKVGLFGARKHLPVLAQYITDSPGPVAISISQTETNSGISFAPEDVAEAMNVIFRGRKAVFVKVACSPSAYRPNVAVAVASAVAQMDAIRTLFSGYQMLNYLKGYCFNNIIFGELFSDNSRWTTTHLNTLLDTAHTQGMHTLVITDPGVASVAKFNQPLPYTVNPYAGNTFIGTASSMGAVSNLTDSIVHMNVLFPWHLYEAEYPELVFDLSRFSAVLSAMRTYQKFNVMQYIHQGSVYAPMPGSFNGNFDGMMGAMMTRHHHDRVMKTANFIEACGVVDYTLSHDVTNGATSNIGLHPLSYRGTNRTAFYDNISITSQNSIINVKNNVSGLVRMFDSTLKETTVS